MEAVLSVESLSRQVLDGVGAVGDERRRVDVGMILWCQDERPLRGLAGYVDWRRHGSLSNMVRSGWCSGSAGESVMLPASDDLPMHRMVLHGLGLGRELDASSAIERAKAAVQVVEQLEPRDVLLAFPGSIVDRDLIDALFTGVSAGLGLSSKTSRAPGEGGASTSSPSIVPWWVVVEDRDTVRLRRLLEGPPRAAES
jgi:hypothetical protein